MAARPVTPCILEDRKLKVQALHEVTIEFKDKVLAGIPKGGNAFDYFVALKTMSDAEKADLIDRIRTNALTPEELQEIKETSWCSFERDHDGYLCMYCNNGKAGMRDILTTYGQFLSKRSAITKKGCEAGGGKNNFQHGIHVDPNHVRFMCSGHYQTRLDDEGIEVRDWVEDFGGEWRPVKHPHGYVDRIKHITDASGKRSALGRHDYLDCPRLTFNLWHPDNSVFTGEDLKDCFALMGDNGMGACRSQQFGKFVCVSWNTINEPGADKREMMKLRQDEEEAKQQAKRRRKAG